MKEILEDLDSLFDEFDVRDELVEENHEIVDILNKRFSHNFKKPIGFGNKAS